MRYLLGLILVFLCPALFAKTLVVKFSKPLTEKQQKLFSGKFTRLTSLTSGPLQNVYTFNSSKNSKGDLNKIKKLNPVYIEETSQIETMAIRPTLGHSYAVNDPYVNYLWGLEFTGQEVLNEINDLENYVIKGSSKSDISTGDLAKLEQAMKKDVVVAIVDTGIDLKHPDLKDNIFTNDVECVRGEIPFEPEQSNDDNDYKGDCKGWDFTGRKEEGSNNPDDFVGHGTHLAGIISAVRNNGIGVAGLTNRIKILPVKVLTNQSESLQAIGTSDRLAKGIGYATEMKVDVINLSLGWPLSFDKQHLQDAINGALEAGIVVIAASGNNDHSEPIMPCAYEGVLCVGSSDPDLKMSDFSNYGAHVDVLAPGNNILSTYPTVSVPGFFDVNGYEIKSGTSQAAPYVSAIAAMLRGIYPEESSNQIKNRIIKTASKPYITDTKFASGGIVSLEKAVRTSDNLVQPKFKGFGRVKVELSKNNSFVFKLDFDKEGDFSTPIKVSLASGKAIKLDNKEFILTGESIDVTGQVKNLDANLSQKFSLIIEEGGSQKEYYFEKRFYIDFEDVKGAEHFEINGGNPKALTELSSVFYHHMPFETPVFYSAISQQNGQVISLYEQKGNKYLNTGNTLLKDASQIMSIHRLDANGDGQPDYLIRYLVEEKDEEGEDVQKLIYSYFNEQLRPLFRKRLIIDGKKTTKDYSHLTLEFENIILEDLDEFSFMPMPYGEFGNILIPVFLGYKDELPQTDRNPNPFARLRKRIFSSRLYYFEPKIKDDKAILITRTINTNAFSDELKRQIKFRANEQIFTVSFEKQSFEDIKQGRFKLLLSHESERKFSKNYMLEVTSLSPVTWSLTKLDSSITMSNFLMGRAVDLNSDTLFDREAESIIVGFEKMSRLNWEEFSVSRSDTLDEISITQPDVNDTLEFPIKTYKNGDSTFRFFQTPSRIFAQIDAPAGQKRLSFPAHISSFLQGTLFREQHYPIVFKQNGENFPALFVDATQIVSRNIYIIKATEDELTAPIKYNVNIPDGCRALNPSLKNGEFYRYTLYCVAGRSKVKFIFIPLNE